MIQRPQPARVYAIENAARGINRLRVERASSHFGTRPPHRLVVYYKQRSTRISQRANRCDRGSSNDGQAPTHLQMVAHHFSAPPLGVKTMAPLSIPCAVLIRSTSSSKASSGNAPRLLGSVWLFGLRPCVSTNGLSRSGKMTLALAAIIAVPL